MQEKAHEEGINNIVKKLNLFFAILLGVYLAVTIPLLFFTQAFTVYWFFFGFFAILIPISVINFLYFGVKGKNFTKQQMIIGVKNALVQICYIWILDIFYMCIFNQWLIAIWIFGSLILIINIIALINNFLSKVKILKKFIPIDVLITIGVTVYLIYIIPDAVLQNIITTITAAFYGGLLTLVGVAWTIRNSAAERELAEKKRDEERKSEERKKYCPRFNVFHPMKSTQPEKYIVVQCEQFYGMQSLLKTKSENQQDLHKVKINNFFIENSSFTEFYVYGIKINSFSYERLSNLFVKKGEYVKFSFNNQFFFFEESIKNIFIVVEDFLGNLYDVELGFKCIELDDFLNLEITGNKRIITDKN